MNRTAPNTIPISHFLIMPTLGRAPEVGSDATWATEVDAAGVVSVKLPLVAVAVSILVPLLVALGKIVEELTGGGGGGGTTIWKSAENTVSPNEVPSPMK